MNTPIADFVRSYQASGVSRMHMPGHKGKPFLGCEGLDITEISGADALYEASGIIAESEGIAGRLFDSQRTVYSTEGSSQCIRAMLYLALMNRPAGSRPVIVAARNVHKAFVYAAAVLDFEVVWLWPEEEEVSLCGCTVTPAGLEHVLQELDTPPAAVYLTSPDYLGTAAPIRELAEVAHRYGTRLLVDNAHGAYLHFLPTPEHPLNLGADLCCDSAHKTLPVLTGGAYLHISKSADAAFVRQAKQAMALFGSTSPSYLTLASLDLCNRYLAEGYGKRLADTTEKIQQVRAALQQAGWQTAQTDPLRITLLAPCDNGVELAQRLREHGVECEYAENACVVLMLTPENPEEDYARLAAALGENRQPYQTQPGLRPARGERVCSIRQALFSPHETIPTRQALGRICAAPMVACPPAIPVVISGERIGSDAMELFARYQITDVDVVKE